MLHVFLCMEHIVNQRKSQHTSYTKVSHTVCKTGNFKKLEPTRDTQRHWQTKATNVTWPASLPSKVQAKGELIRPQPISRAQWTGRCAKASALLPPPQEPLWCFLCASHCYSIRSFSKYTRNIHTSSALLIALHLALPLFRSQATEPPKRASAATNPRNSAKVLAFTLAFGHFFSKSVNLSLFYAHIYKCACYAKLGVGRVIYSKCSYLQSIFSSPWSYPRSACTKSKAHSKTITSLCPSANSWHLNIKTQIKWEKWWNWWSFSGSPCAKAASRELPVACGVRARQTSYN